MKLLACAENVDPCPVAMQVWIDASSMIDFGALGINAASIFRVIGWGFGVVLAAWAIGYAAGVAIRMVNKA